MNALLICPSSRPGVQHLGEFAPLAAFPILGESLLEYWLAHLSERGTKHVRILADDRPNAIASRTGGGSRWGLEVEICAEDRELAPPQALLKYGDRSPKSNTPGQVLVLDRLPGDPQNLLFASYAHFFSGVLKWIPKARTPDRVGIRQVRRGVWIGLQAHVSPQAQLHPPCWIGKQAYVGPGSVLGPMAVLEDRVFVEPESEITGSMIGPDTFVGRSVAIHDSIAWGATLIHWKSGVSTRVQDAFLLSALRHNGVEAHAEPLLERLAEIYSRNKGDLQIFWKNVLLRRSGP
jgi:NDP-sugar pyrophosphorylase family protein